MEVTETLLLVLAALIQKLEAMDLLMTGQLPLYLKYNILTSIILMRMLLRSKDVLKQLNKLLCHRKLRTEQ
jgi:hypothetical protein